MSFLIAQKIAMTRRFREDGRVVPVTVLKAGPCFVTQVKTTAHDGYQAVQLGFGFRRHVSKPQRTAWGKHFALTREFRVKSVEGFEPGKSLDASVFSLGERVRVTGISKGKGFAGVVKRHHFAGGPASHGHKDNLRMPGSIGATFPQHVMKGTKMAGRMGGDKVSIRNLEVVEVIPKHNLVVVRGAVPGPRNGYLLLQSLE